MSENKTNHELPDISGLFDIDESSIPTEIIEKSPTLGTITTPILTSEEAMRKLPKEARKDIETDNKAKKKRATAKKRKNTLKKAAIILLALMLGISIIDFIIDRAKMPSVTVDSPVIQTISRYHEAPAVAVNKNNTVFAALIDNDYDLHYIEAGQIVEITLPDSTKTYGKVFEIKEEKPEDELISKNFNVLTGSLPSTPVYAVYVTFNDLSLSLKDGTVLSAKIITKMAENAVTLPSSAVLQDDNGYYVWSYSSFKKCLKRIDITVGITVDGITEITSGLEKSDKIAITFSCLPEQLYEDIKVKTK